jgi:hypothetical protein
VEEGDAEGMDARERGTKVTRAASGERRYGESGRHGRRLRRREQGAAEPELQPPGMATSRSGVGVQGKGATSSMGKKDNCLI